MIKKKLNIVIVMSAAGVITDTMANIRTAKDASGKEYTYKFPVMTKEEKDDYIIRKHREKRIDKQKSKPNEYKIPFNADYGGLLGFANVFLHKGNKIIGNPKNLSKGEREKLARLTIKLLFAPNPLYNDPDVKPVKSIDPLILSCFTNPLQKDGGVLIKMIGTKVSGSLIYDDDEFPMFSRDVEYLNEKTVEAAKILNLY